MKSLFEQIQELSYIPNYRNGTHPGSRFDRYEAHTRAATWKAISDRLWDCRLKLADIDSLNASAADLEVEVAALTQARDALKTQYWR